MRTQSSRLKLKGQIEDWLKMGQMIMDVHTHVVTCQEHLYPAYTRRPLNYTDNNASYSDTTLKIVEKGEEKGAVSCQYFQNLYENKADKYKQYISNLSIPYHIFK